MALQARWGRRHGHAGPADRNAGTAWPRRRPWWRGGAAPGWVAGQVLPQGRLRAERLGPFGGHGGDYPLEVVQGGELDHDLALVAAELDFDFGVEHVRQLVRQRVEAGGGGLLGRGAAGLGGLVAAHGYDLFHCAYRQAFGDDAVRQAVLGVGVVEGQEGAGVAGTEYTGRDPALDRGRQVQEPDGVGDVRPGPSDLVGELVVGGAEVIEQLLVGGRLVERVELLPVQVLHQRFAEHLIVSGAAHDDRDVLQARTLARPPAPFAHDQLIAPRHDLADHHRLQQPDLLDRGCQLVQVVLIKAPSRLAWVRGNGTNRHFLEISPLDPLHDGIDAIRPRGRCRAGHALPGARPRHRGRRRRNESP